MKKIKKSNMTILHLNSKAGSCIALEILYLNKTERKRA